jgi:hypothetical protein
LQAYFRSLEPTDVADETLAILAVDWLALLPIEMELPAEELLTTGTRDEVELRSDDPDGYGFGPGWGDAKLAVESILMTGAIDDSKLRGEASDGVRVGTQDRPLCRSDTVSAWPSFRLEKFPEGPSYSLFSCW